MSAWLEAGARSFVLVGIVILALSSALVEAQEATVRRSSNLRSEASTSSSIVSKLANGNRLTITGDTKSGYYPVRTRSGKSGWVWAKNISTSGNKPSTARTTSNAGFQVSCQQPSFPAGPAPIDSKACGVDGNGGAEASQNEAKNNFCAADPPERVTIERLVQLQQSVESNGSIPFGNTRNHPLSSDPGPATDRGSLAELGEGHEVVLVGYVNQARQEGAESVNCGKSGPVPNQAVYHDIHISIVSSPGDSECNGVVAEMIPHHRPTSWTPTVVNQVATSKLSVRVTGQLMFDSSHTPCQAGKPLQGDPARVSLWEIHPIYKFEVCTNGSCSDGRGWTDLENWQQQ